MERQVGQLSTQHNTRQKGGVPSDIVVNPKNEAHVMEIVTRSGRKLNNNLVKVEENPLDKHASAKSKRLVK